MTPPLCEKTALPSSDKPTVEEDKTVLRHPGMYIKLSPSLQNLLEQWKELPPLEDYDWEKECGTTKRKRQDDRNAGTNQKSPHARLSHPDKANLLPVQEDLEDSQGTFNSVPNNVRNRSIKQAAPDVNKDGEPRLSKEDALAIQDALQCDDDTIATRNRNIPEPHPSKRRKVTPVARSSGVREVITIHDSSSSEQAASGYDTPQEDKAGYDFMNINDINAVAKGAVECDSVQESLTSAVTWEEDSTAKQDDGDDAAPIQVTPVQPKKLKHNSKLPTTKLNQAPKHARNDSAGAGWPSPPQGPTTPQNWPNRPLPPTRPVNGWQNRELPPPYMAPFAMGQHYSNYPGHYFPPPPPYFGPPPFPPMGVYNDGRPFPCSNIPDSHHYRQPQYQGHVQLYGYAPGYKQQQRYEAAGNRGMHHDPRGMEQYDETQDES